VITHPSYRVRPRGNMRSSIIMITHSFGWVPSCVPGRTDPGDPGALRSSSPSAVLSFACELMPSFTKTSKAYGLEEPHALLPRGPSRVFS